VLAEAKAAGLGFDVLAVREGDKLPFHSESRVTLSAAAFRAATQTVTPQGVIAIARVDEASPVDAIASARQAGWPLIVLDGVQDPGNVGPSAGPPRLRGLRPSPSCQGRPTRTVRKRSGRQPETCSG